MEQYFDLNFMEDTFGAVVDKHYDVNKRTAFVTLNWLSSKDRARAFFKSKGCHVMN